MMVNIITKYRDSSFSQSEVEVVGKEWGAPKKKKNEVGQVIKRMKGNI